MHFSTIVAAAALFGGSTMAIPAYRRSLVCPGLESTPQCCAVDVLGVADVNCAPPPMVPANVTAFTAMCAAIGQQAQCCTLPILGQALLCESPP